MTDVTSARFTKESIAIAEMAKRDLARRVAPAITIALLCFYAGQTIQAFAFLLAILSLEGAALTISAHILKSRDAPRRSIQLAQLVVAVATVTVISLPAFILGQTGVIAFLLTGTIWLTGLMYFVANSYGPMPFYNWFLITPTGLATIAFVLIFAGDWSGALGPIPVIGALGVLMIGIVNSLDAMTRQRRFFNIVNKTKEDARERLQQLEYLTNHDSLTNLMNRRAFERHATALIEDEANFSRRASAVFLLDLDGFKPVNDSYSHAAGDALLCQIGKRLQEHVGKAGFVARLGGDEFAVVIRHLPDDDECLALGRELADCASEPVTFEQRPMSVTASVGIAKRKRGSNLRELLAEADQAMYAAKGIQGPAALVFDRTTFPVRATLSDRKTLMAALEAREITPYYQPKIDIRTGKIVGMEALARWEHPEKGLVTPGHFLPLVAELGMQGEFLMHTLKTTFEHVRSFVDEGIDPGLVSVNLPEVTLATAAGRETLLDLLRMHPLALPHMTFEVTEDIFIARSAAVIQRSIQQFRRMGVRISLDDFGTGFASFAHLRELEFDELKLDTAFVQALGEDDAANVLVKAFLDIGTGLRVDIVAEGIETAVQRDLLVQMGCTLGQGYLYSKAIPFADIRKMIINQASHDDAA